MSPFPFGNHMGRMLALTLTIVCAQGEPAPEVLMAGTAAPFLTTAPETLFPSSCLSAWKYKGGKAGTSCQDHGRAWQIAADMSAAGSSMWLAHGDTLGWAGEGTAATSLLSSSQTLLAQDSALERDPGSLLLLHSGSGNGSSSLALGRQLPTRLLLPLFTSGCSDLLAACAAARGLLGEVLPALYHGSNGQLKAWLSRWDGQSPSGH